MFKTVAIEQNLEQALTFNYLGFNVDSDKKGYHKKLQRFQ